jgi:hypothetical protein
MKKLVLALSAVAAFTGSALAADLPARTYSKAPMMAPVYNWTGFYISSAAPAVGCGMLTATFRAPGLRAVLDPPALL